MVPLQRLNGRQVGFGETTGCLTIHQPLQLRVSPLALSPFPLTPPASFPPPLKPAFTLSYVIKRPTSRARTLSSSPAHTFHFALSALCYTLRTRALQSIFFVDTAEVFCAGYTNKRVPPSSVCTKTVRENIKKKGSKGGMKGCTERKNSRSQGFDCVAEDGRVQ